MGIAQLIVKKGNYINKIQLDIIITEGASTSSRVTSNPVEFGANINDHVIIEPMTFTVSGVVSNVSSNISDTLSGGLGLIKSKLAWEDLLKLQIDRTPFKLVQGLKEYPNVVIISLSEQQDKDTSNGLFFEATMKELIYVGSQVVSADQFLDSDISDSMIPAITGGLKQLK